PPWSGPPLIRRPFRSSRGADAGPDAREVQERAQKGERGHLGAGGVHPLVQRELVDPICAGIRALSSEDAAVPCKHLDVEEPPRPEWTGQYVLQRRVHAEELGTTLRVVDGQPEAD